MKLVIFLGATLFVLVATPSYAQQRYQSPSGPTITPYLDYFRQPTGVLDRYNQYVVPRRQMRQRLTQQDTLLRGLNTRVSEVNDEIQRVREPTITPTGVGSSFMNYSHFYNMSGPSR
jgi:hypothetical protein